MILQYLVSGPPPPSDNLPGRLSLGIASRLSPKRATVRSSPGIFGDLMTMMDGHFKEWRQMGNNGHTPWCIFWKKTNNHCTFWGRSIRILWNIGIIEIIYQDNIIRLGGLRWEISLPNSLATFLVKRQKFLGRSSPQENLHVGCHLGWQALLLRMKSVWSRISHHV